MKRPFISAALAIAFIIALIGGISAQTKPNFAGKWQADDSFNSWTITVDGNKMTVTMTVAGNSESTVYLLDGTPSKKAFEGPNGPAENVSTTTWEGDVLVTTTQTAFGTTLTEKRWLDPDGTMRIQMSLSIPGKPSPPPGPPMILKRLREPASVASAVSVRRQGAGVGPHTTPRSRERSERAECPVDKRVGVGPHAN